MKERTKKTIKYYIYSAMLGVLIAILGLYLLERQAPIMAMIAFYSSLVLLTASLAESRYTLWLRKIIMVPMIVLNPIRNIFGMVFATILGIAFCGGGILIISRLVFSGLFEIPLSLETQLYIVLTIGAIFATQEFYGKFCNKYLRIFYFGFGNVYDINIAKYTIYLLYFFTLIVINLLAIDDTLYNIAIIPAFATYIAYERLISNKRIVKDINLRGVKDIPAAVRNLMKSSGNELKYDSERKDKWQ